MTHFFSRCSEQKIESFSPKNLGQILVLPVFHFFRSKWLIFLSVHDAKKLSHFDLKIWVKFLFCQWLNFLGQNDSFFLSVKESEKIESFWPKNLGQILVPPVIQFFRSKWFFFLSVHEAKKLSHFDPKIWVNWSKGQRRLIINLGRNLTQKFGSNFSSANLVPNFSQI